MIQPSPRAVLVFGGAVPLALLVASVYPPGWVLALDYALVALLALAVDAGLAWPAMRLGVEISTPATLAVGQAGRLTATVTGPRRATRLELLAEQEGALEPAAPASLALAPGEAGSAVLDLLPRRRGRVRIVTLWLRWMGPLGLARVTRRVPVDRTIDVLPDLRGIRQAALQYFSDDALHGSKVQRQKGEGAEYDALRDYAPGLDTRFIDWKHSAHHRKLLCKEFRTERNHNVIVAFDTGYLMVEPLAGTARLDHAISAGLALAWVALQTGDLVGLYGFDATVRHFVRPTRGVAGFGRLQRETAALDYHHEETNFTLGLAALSQRLPRRALVVLFTDFTDTVTAELMVESLRWLSSRHLVVFVTLSDPYLDETVDAAPERFEQVAEAVVAHDLRRDRAIVLDRLQRLGVHCLDLPHRGLSAGLLNRYLLIKQRGLI